MNTNQIKNSYFANCLKNEEEYEASENQLFDDKEISFQIIFNIKPNE